MLSGSADESRKSHIIQELGVDGSPQAIKLLAESLSYPDFPLKDSALEFLMRINTPEVYAALLTVIGKLSPGALTGFKKLSQQVSLQDHIMKSIEMWKGDKILATVVAAMLTILGFVGDESHVNQIVTFLYHMDKTIQTAAVDSLKRIGSPSCLNYLYSPLKLAEPDLGHKILNLVGLFRNRSCIIPLLAALGDFPPDMQKQAVAILCSFPVNELQSYIKGNLDIKDPDMCRNAVLLFEMSGQLEAARRIRKMSGLTETLSSTPLSHQGKLEFQVKKTGDIGLVALAGVLDIYTLPKFQKLIETMVTKGHLKLLLFCEQVTKTDVEFLIALENLAQKLESYSGSLMIIGLHAIDKNHAQKYLKKIEIFSDVKKALMSFSRQHRERTVRFTDDMARIGLVVEVEVQSGSKSWTRHTKVVGYDGKNLTLEWISRGEMDIFQDYLSQAIKLTLVYKNTVITFNADVSEQVFHPAPIIIVAVSKMGMVIDRRRHVRASSQMPVSFHHVITSSNIRKDLQGQCLNISAGGMMLSTRENIPINDLVLVCFEEGSEFKDKKVLGRVVRVTERVAEEAVYNDFGISFLQIQAGVMAVITQFVFETLSSSESESEQAG